MYIKFSLQPNLSTLLTPKLSYGSISNSQIEQEQLSSVYIKPDRKSLLKTILNPMFKKYDSQDQLMKNNPLQHPIVQSSKSQQYLESFHSYLQGSFNPQEMIFSKNFPKLLSRIQDQDMKQKYIHHSVKRNKFLQRSEEQITEMGVEQQRKLFFEREENKFEKHFMLKGSDETKKKLRFIDQKWLMKEANNKKNAIQRAGLRWGLISQVVQGNIELRQRLNKKNQNFQQQNQSKILKLMQNNINEQIQVQPQELRNSKLNGFTVLAVPPMNSDQMLQMAKLKYTSTTARHRQVLMSLYFRTNADSFVHVSRDPFPFQYRKLLIQSDVEYNKVLQTYLNKVSLYEKWLQEQDERHNMFKKQSEKIKTNQTNQSQSINISSRKPMERASNPLILSNQIQGQERLYMDRLADLECYNQSHMQKTLINDKFIDKERKFYKKKKTKIVHGISTQSSNQFYTTIKHNKMNFYTDKTNYSNDNSNASITEQALDSLYNETNVLSKKLVNKQKPPKEERSIQIMRRIKTLLKLDEVQRKIIQANLIRLKV